MGMVLKNLFFMDCLVVVVAMVFQFCLVGFDLLFFAQFCWFCCFFGVLVGAFLWFEFCFGGVFFIWFGFVFWCLFFLFSNKKLT